MCVPGDGYAYQRSKLRIALCIDSICGSFSVRAVWEPIGTLVRWVGGSWSGSVTAHGGEHVLAGIVPAVGIVFGPRGFVQYVGIPLIWLEKEGNASRPVSLLLVSAVRSNAVLRKRMSCLRLGMWPP
jgi:hypothetical protein